MTENEVGELILGAAMKVHAALGPGLLESAYETCLDHELEKRGLGVQRQVPVAVEYDGQRVEGGFRLDLLVEKIVVVEVKAVERLMPIHFAQTLTYLKFGGFKLGYVLNFNVLHMRQGIKRIVNGL